MNDLDNSAFTQLFKDACKKCFGHPLQNVLTETESKLFCNHIIDKTGLIIGFKSIKNYSAFVLNDATGKEANPSIATLDTLARYVTDAPYTDETKRKNTESHYPYWFAYKEKFLRSAETPATMTAEEKKPPKKGALLPGTAAVLLIIAVMVYVLSGTRQKQFAEDFHSVHEDSLTGNGWFVQSKDNQYWQRRNEKQGHLTLYTLKGDNWPDSSYAPNIKNLLLRKIEGECFTAEVHFTGFVPGQNWQQAGILLLEDTAVTGRSMRLSVAYNDYSGGYPVSRQVIIQAITSLGKGFGKPEEIAHTPIMFLDSASKNPALIKNLDHTALRIEKHGKKFRLLYADGVSENTAFKEVVSQEFDMQPKYIALFALKGFVDKTGDMPVYIKYFRLSDEPCDK